MAYHVYADIGKETMTIDFFSRLFQNFTESIRYVIPLFLTVVIYVIIRQRMKIRTLRKDVRRIDDERDRFRIFFEGSSDALFLIIGSVLVDCNRSAEIMFGLDRSRILGRNPGELSPPAQPDGSDSIGYASQFIRDAFASGGGVIEWMHRRGDGADFWVELLLKPVVCAGKPALVGTVRDVSHRKQTQDALRESEEKFRILVENISETIFSIDNAGICTYISPVVETQLGYRPDEIIGRSFISFVYPDDQPGIAEDFIHTLSGKPELYEFRVIRRDGMVRRVITSSNVIRNNDRITGIIGIMTDITEHKIHEEELREAVNFRRALLDRSAVGLLLASTDRNILEANKRLGEMFGYKASELAGQSLRIIHISEKHYRDFEIYYDRLRTEGIVTNEMPFRRSDGGMLWCSVSGTLFEPGNPDKGIIWTLVDITDRRRIEEQIHSSQQRLSLLVEQAILGVVEWDLDFRVKEWNPAAERMFGYTRGDAMGRSAYELIIPDNMLAYIKAVWAELLDQKGGSRSLNTNITKDGRVIMCEWYSTPLVDDTGRTIGVTSMIDDVTEKMKIDMELMESREKLHALVTAAQDGVVLIDSEGIISLWNHAAERIFGYSEKEVLGRNLHDFATPHHMWDVYRKWMADYRLTGTESMKGQTMEIDVMRKGGEEFPIELSLSPVTIGGRWHAVGLVRDITKRRKARNAMKEANRRLEELAGALSFQACHDSLTGIYNRRAILDMLGKEYSHVCRNGHPFTMAIFDLDHFKDINDMWGHQTGDDVLSGFVEIMRQHLREYDHLGRYGGEEFLVITPGCNGPQAEDLYNRLCSMVAETPVSTRSGMIHITVSGGVTEVDGRQSIDALLGAADGALYRAKAAGRNRVVFTWKV